MFIFKLVTRAKNLASAACPGGEGAVLKTVGPRGLAGSNPVCSAYSSLKGKLHMNRDRAYYRRMRARSIKKKKARSAYYQWYYEHDGMYSKGKIHCSCAGCSPKTKNKKYKRRHKHANYNPSYNWKHSDLLKIQEMEYELKEYAS